MKQTKPNKDIVTIGHVWTGEDRPPSFICSYCNRTLTRLTDRSGKNESWYYNNCSIEFNPENENIGKESKITVPNRNQEPCVTSIQCDYNKEGSNTSRTRAQRWSKNVKR
jgi:hypothetical protein